MLAGRILLEPVTGAAGARSDAVRSPNGAYWFCVDAEWSSRPDAGEGIRFGTSSPDVDILIFNEREHLIGLSLVGHYINYDVYCSWISEKLLFIRVWWGRAVGSDMILDVESEEMLYLETVCDGTIPYRQFGGVGGPGRGPDHHE